MAKREDEKGPSIRQAVRRHLFVPLEPAIWKLLTVQCELVRRELRRLKKKRPSRAEIVGALLTHVLSEHGTGILDQWSQVHDEEVSRQVRKRLRSVERARRAAE